MVAKTGDDEEVRRLAVLRRLALLDTEPERAFDNIVRLAARLARTPIALVSLVDEHRQWFKARCGLDQEGTSREVAFCDHAIRTDEVMWIEDARADPRFTDNPLVIGKPRIRFYAGAPIRVDNQRVGTVCVIASRARPYDPELAAQLAMLAEIAADECHRRLVIHDLDEARRQAAAASDAKSQFLANMSHELRTPLNGVVGVASVLEADGAAPRQREMIGIIQSSARALASLLDDVLDLSRIEAGRLELQLASFRLDELIGQVLDGFRLRAEEKGLELRAERLPTTAYLGDEVRLRQVLSNLVSNAVKFTDAGEVVVEVEVHPRDDGDRLRITVRDTGPGFDDAFGERIFERFEQADPSMTRRHGGSGLGLAISKSLAELMGGNLSAEASPGEGARFTIEIELQACGALALLQTPEADPSSDLQAMRVLVADDHPTNRRVVELILSGLGVDCTCVENGAEAVAAFEADRFDVVIMDVQMPVMDGLEAIRRIRAHEVVTGRPRTTIYTLSAHAMPQHIGHSLEAGADDHLTKPITAEQLLAAICAVGETDQVPTALSA